MTILEVKDLYFGYNEEDILKGINFKVEDGQVLCLFGPNGCGKTTMLDCILGLNKIRKGDVIVEGMNTKDLKPEEMAQKIAYVPQKHNRTFPYSVLEIVLMGRTAYTSMFTSPGKEDIQIAEESLEKVGMYKFKDRVFTSLSGGEAQLVKIARALAQNTKLLIFDEPTSHLDFRHELNVLKYTVELVKENNISILMATHFPNHAFYLENNGINTKVAMIEEGTFGAFGMPSQILNEENMKNIFKIETKVFEYIENNKKLNYIVPIDFSINSK